MVFVLGMLATHAQDAAYMVYVPLAGDRVRGGGATSGAGLIAGFAGAAVGLAGNLLPGQYDVLLLGITETGARLLAAGLDDEPARQLVFLDRHRRRLHGLGWWVRERVVAPRLGKWKGRAASPNSRA